MEGRRGTALLRASKALDGLKVKGDQQFGVEIIKRACEAPMRQIAENAGTDGAVVVSKVLEKETPSFGYNAATGAPTRGAAETATSGRHSPRNNALVFIRCPLDDVFFGPFSKY